MFKEEIQNFRHEHLKNGIAIELRKSIEGKKKCGKNQISVWTGEFRMSNRHSNGKVE